MKQITKKRYKTMVWMTLGFGLLVNAVAYTYLTYQRIGTSNLQAVGVLAIGCIIIGYALGLANAHTHKIDGI